MKQPEIIFAFSRLVASRKNEQLVALDLGANTGFFSLKFAILSQKYNENLKVYSFEGGKIFEEHQNLIKQNNLEHIIIPTNAGIWNETKKLKFISIPSKSATGHIVSGFEDYDKLKELQAVISEIQVYTIDDLMALHNLKKIDFIKLDIEGAD